MNLASDGKVTMQELVRSDVNYTTVATIGGQDAYFNITVVGHPVPLTLGVAVRFGSRPPLENFVLEVLFFCFLFADFCEHIYREWV